MSHGGMLGILDSLTGGEVLLVLLVALLVLGPERLPETARSIGQFVAKARKMTSGLQNEVREVLDDPSMKPIRDIGEFAASPRKKLIDFANEADRDATEARKKAGEAAAAAESAEKAAAEAKAEAEAVLGSDAVAEDETTSEPVAGTDPVAVAEDPAEEPLDFGYANDDEPEIDDT